VAELTVLGVDGCPGGWVGAVVTLPRRAGTRGPAELAGWLVLPDAATLVATARSTDAAGVDMPIGLADAGPRACDLEARRLLGRRASSVFPAPVRAVLGSSSYEEACARSVAACGRALSKQTWAIVPRIADLDAHVTPTLQSRLVEVHPELVFVRLTGAALPAKKTPAGAAARLAALGRWLPDPAAAVARAPRPARADDALDALACAWAAARWATATALVLPAEPPRDARGLRMEIVS
jgi:predicted RNase H-like nuclease